MKELQTLINWSMWDIMTFQGMPWFNWFLHSNFSQMRKISDILKDMRRVEEFVLTRRLWQRQEVWERRWWNRLVKKYCQDHWISLKSVSQFVSWYQRLPSKQLFMQVYMCIKSILASIFPLYIGKATMTPDFLERFKLVITATLSSFFWTNTFLKPVHMIITINLAQSHIRRDIVS